MKQQRTLQWLVGVVILASACATIAGIFSSGGDGSYAYTSIRGVEVFIWGRGLYRHMSAEVAPQGIAQDVVTLFIALPLLAYACFGRKKYRLRQRFLLAGTLGYFFVTYLFYTVMGMFNECFLLYVLLLSTSFYGCLLACARLPLKTLPRHFAGNTPIKVTAFVLIGIAGAIALLWLGIVVPPLLDGSIFPPELAHYTTLIVQGLDLALLLPAAMISAVLWMKRKPLGYLVLPVYFIFLSLLMTALTAKVIAMSWLGYPVMPVIIIIPLFNVVTLACTVIILGNIKEKETNTIKHHETIPLAEA